MNKHGLRTGLALALPGLLSGLVYLLAVQAQAAPLEVEFKGALIDRMCVFEQEGTALEVAFPTRALKYFAQHPRTDTEPFVIALKNCTVATQDKLVDLTFSAERTTDVAGMPMLATDGGTGLVIGLVDGEGNAIRPDQPVEAGTITTSGNGTVNRFTLGAYVMAPPGVTVVAGRYSATTTFTVSYR